jgi:hypothetical protein
VSGEGDADAAGRGVVGGGLDAEVREIVAGRVLERRAAQDVLDDVALQGSKCRQAYPWCTIWTTTCAP